MSAHNMTAMETEARFSLFSPESPGSHYRPQVSLELAIQAWWSILKKGNTARATIPCQKSK